MDAWFWVFLAVPLVIGVLTCAVAAARVWSQRDQDQPIEWWRPWFSLLVGVILGIVFGVGSCFACVALFNGLSGD